MRLATFFAGIFVAATAVVASPIQSFKAPQGPSGNVADANMKAYMLHDTEKGNTRIIANKTHGEFMRPVSLRIEQGHGCKFYSEATRGIGYLIGEYQGPLDGTFGKDWAAFYECWSIAEKPLPKAPTIAVKLRDIVRDTVDMIPCGYVRTSTGGQMYLNESGKGHMVEFAINGESYTPTFYHVLHGCKCIFFSARTVRGGPVPIAEADGPMEGNFSDPKASRYQCWIRF